MSEQILKGTSTQLGYKVPFTSVHTGKYVTEDKSRTDTTKNKDKPEKANNTKYSKIKLDWLSRLLRHQPGNKVGLFYSVQCSRGDISRGDIIIV